MDCDVSVTLYSDDLSKSQMTLPLVRYHCVMFSLSFSYDMFERILSLQGSTKKKVNLTSTFNIKRQLCNCI